MQPRADEVRLRRVNLHGTAAAIEAARVPLRIALDQSSWPSTAPDEILLLRRIEARGNPREIAAGAATQAHRLAASAVDGWFAAASNAVAIRFPSHASLTACLLRDLLQETAAKRWYWRHWQNVLQQPAATAIVALLQETPLELPAVMALLQGTSAWKPFWQALGQDGAATLVACVTQATGWRIPAQTSPPIPQTEAETLATTQPATSITPSINLTFLGCASHDSRPLLAALLTLWQQAPSLLAQSTGADELRRLARIIAGKDIAPPQTSEQQVPDTPAPEQTASEHAASGLSDSGLSTSAPSTSASSAAGPSVTELSTFEPSVFELSVFELPVFELPVFEQPASGSEHEVMSRPPKPADTMAGEPSSNATSPAAGQSSSDAASAIDSSESSQPALAGNSQNGTAPPRTSEKLRVLDQAEEILPPEHTQVAPGQTAIGSEDNRAPIALRPEGFVTRQGGLLFLLNFLNLPSVRQQLPTALPGAGWRWLHDLATALGAPPEGELLELLAHECGMQNGAELSAQPPATPLESMLRLGAGRYGDGVWQAATWQIPARLIASPSHIDLHFRLNDANPAVRRTGLDINPGWLPWLGRVVTFHYGSSLEP